MNRALVAAAADLRRLAQRQLRRIRVPTSMSPTTVVHECYLRLVRAASCPVEDRAQLLSFAAVVMRNLLLDRVRSETRHDNKPVGNCLSPGICQPTSVATIDVQSALERLARRDPLGARIAEYRYLLGMTAEECAGVLGLGVATVHRRWSAVRRELRNLLIGYAVAEPPGAPRDHAASPTEQIEPDPPRRRLI